MDSSHGEADPRLACSACGAVHRGARLVDLPDGRILGNYSEEYRRFCEAVWVLKRFRVKRTRQEYLAGVQEKRGLQAMLDLRQEMLRVWDYKQRSAQR